MNEISDLVELTEALSSNANLTCSSSRKWRLIPSLRTSSPAAHDARTLLTIAHHSLPDESLLPLVTKPRAECPRTIPAQTRTTKAEAKKRKKKASSMTITKFKDGPKLTLTTRKSYRRRYPKIPNYSNTVRNLSRFGEFNLKITHAAGPRYQHFIFILNF